MKQRLVKQKLQKVELDKIEDAISLFHSFPLQKRISCRHVCQTTPQNQHIEITFCITIIANLFSYL